VLVLYHDDREPRAVSDFRLFSVWHTPDPLGLYRNPLLRGAWQVRVVRSGDSGVHVVSNTFDIDTDA